MCGTNQVNLYIYVLSVSLTGQRLINGRSFSWKLSDDLIVIFIDIQPAATFKRIFLHRQGLEQSDLQKVAASSIIIHVFIFVSSSFTFLSVLTYAN